LQTPNSDENWQTSCFS